MDQIEVPPDFTHRDYRPDHQPNPTRRGIAYDPFMSPQKAGSLLCKVAFKSKFKPGAKAKSKPAVKAAVKMTVKK